LKIIKKYYILIIFTLVLLIFNLGIYQSHSLNLGNLTISKPFGYRFHSIPSGDDISKLELLKNYFGFYTSFELKDKIVTLIFKKFYLKNTVSLTLTSFKNESKIFKYKNNLKQSKDEENCIYKITEIVEKDDELYSIDGLIKNMNTSFYILGNNENDVINLKNDICTK